MKKDSKTKLIDPLCVAVKEIRAAYGESQEQFARRVELSSMTISRFELGKQVPTDPAVLGRLRDAAREHGDLTHQAQLFSTAYLKARLGYKPQKPPATTYEISFRSIEEWRLMLAVRIADRWFRDEAVAVQNVLKKSLWIVDMTFGSGELAEDAGLAEVERQADIVAQEQLVKQYKRQLEQRAKEQSTEQAKESH